MARPTDSIRMPRQIAALPQPPKPMPRLTPEQRRAEVEAIAKVLRESCAGSEERMDRLFRQFVYGERP